MDENEIKRMARELTLTQIEQLPKEIHDAVWRELADRLWQHIENPEMEWEFNTAS